MPMGSGNPCCAASLSMVLPGGLGSLSLAGRQQQWPVWWEQEHYTRNGREKRLVVFLSVGEGVGQAVAPRNVTISLWEFRHSSSSYLCLEGRLPAGSIPAVLCPTDGHLVPLILSPHLFAQPCSPGTFLSCWWLRTGSAFPGQCPAAG